MLTLKKIIGKDMLKLTFISVIIMLAVMLYIQMLIEQKRAYETAMRNFVQIEQLLEQNGRELIEIRREYWQKCLDRGQVVARIIEDEPEIIYSVSALMRLAQISGVDEIHIFDTSGRIFAGTHPKYYNYTFDSGEQMAFFKPMLKDKSLKLVQDIRPNTAEKKPMQYSALWSSKGDIIVQIGMEPVNVLKLTKKNELSYVFSWFRIPNGAQYYAVDAQKGVIVGASDVEHVGKTLQELGGLTVDDIKTRKDGFFAKVNGVDSFCVFTRIRENYVGRVIAKNILYQHIPGVLMQTVISLIALALILALAITAYMNRFVVEKIQAINEKLNTIAQGNFYERIDVRSSREFSDLSSYLNIMIKRLLDNNKKLSYVLSKTNLYMGVYEYNSNMRRVYFTEYLPKLLGLDAERMNSLAADYSLFKEFMDGLRQYPVPDEPGVFRISEEPKQYVRLEEINEQDEILGVVIDVSEQILRRRKIELERDIDSLTCFYNRRGMDLQLEALFRSPESLGCCAFVMIDTDDLKLVNDTYGHQKGDLYLQGFAGILRSLGLQSCLAARQGGDEFLLFLYGYADEKELEAVIRELTSMQEGRQIQLSERLSVPLHFSMGYGMCEEGKPYTLAIKEADQMMYKNKRERKKKASAGQAGRQ